jgi:UDP-3-O-[3-hydroxymyristoyl] glucosamine N-acyltransferase
MLPLRELAASLGAELRHATGEETVGRVAGLRLAGPDALVFAEDEATLAEAVSSPAVAVAVSARLAGQAGSAKPLLVTTQPRLAFARSALLLRGAEPPSGIHPTAVVEATAVLAPGVSVGACAVVGEKVIIGEGSSVGAGAVIGAGVVIGRQCRIYPRAVLYPGTTLGDRVVVHAGAVLGADGFGYVRDAASGEYLQFPQQGTLVIEDDVEIGANTTIDRGALEETRIARGVKLDNLVHIGHNCDVGPNVVIASLTGVSGSTSIGANAILGGQVGIGDHASVGEGVILGGQAGILPHKKIRGPGVLFWGTPAKPLKTYLREIAALSRLSRASKKQGSSDSEG